jgi:hypothetical protein
MSDIGKAEKLRLAEARVSGTAIPAEWAEQIMEMISACYMKSIEGTDWDTCEEIALCIKRQHPPRITRTWPTTRSRGRCPCRCRTSCT